MFYDLRYKSFIFFFSILFIQDTVFFSYKSITHKRILRSLTFCTIDEIFTIIPAIITKVYIITCFIYKSGIINFETIV